MARAREVDGNVLNDLMEEKTAEKIYRSLEEYEVSLLCSESIELILPGNNIRILLGVG